VDRGGRHQVVSFAFIYVLLSHITTTTKSLSAFNRAFNDCCNLEGSGRAQQTGVDAWKHKRELYGSGCLLSKSSVNAFGCRYLYFSVVYDVKNTATRVEHCAERKRK